MPYQLEPFADTGLNETLLASMMERHESTVVPSMRLLWTYYRNPIVSLSSAAGSASGRVLRGNAAHTRMYRLGQERGLPARLVGKADRSIDDRADGRREIVIENDIGWRVHTMVDFMFGKRITIASNAADESMRRTIERVLDAVWEASGGIGLLQDMGLLGHVYGHVDVLVRRQDESADDLSETGADPAQEAANAVCIEIIEPTRGVPLLSQQDFRTLSAYVLRYQRTDRSNTDHPNTGTNQSHARNGTTSALARVLGRNGDSGPAGASSVVTVTEVFSASRRQVYEETIERTDGGILRAGRRGESGPRLVEDQPNRVSIGTIPVVHTQNISQPFAYTGLSEVEPLIPLQDELNTRLCDRASRVTMQSFRMFLAKGIDGFDKTPVSPGQVWSTDNVDAKVESFGGDADAPGEAEHIEQVREAMDKASSVPPLASGVVRAKIGNLTSENALRVTLLGLLSKTARKRVTYGRGIAQVCTLILDALNDAGILRTSPADRGVRIEWPDPLPRDEKELLDAARTKLELGVPRERVLSELGYSPADPGIE